MKYRTILITTLALLMMFALAGCSADGNASDLPKENDDSSSTTGLITSENQENQDQVDKVMETLKYLFDGYVNQDGELGMEAFHPTATLYCPYYANGIAAEDYCKRYVNDEIYTQSYQEHKMIYVDITDDRIATAKIEYRDADGSPTYKAYYSLRYNAIEYSWKIIGGNHYKH